MGREGIVKGETKRKKLQAFGVECLGFLGIVLWPLSGVLRKWGSWDNGLYRWILASLPNLALAWLTTLLGKWLVILLFKKTYTRKKHLITCITIFCLGLISELLYHFFWGSSFDLNDMLMTVLAQLMMFFAGTKTSTVETGKG